MPVRSNPALIGWDDPAERAETLRYWRELDSPRFQLQRDYLNTLGLPKDWLPYCQVMEWDGWPSARPSANARVYLTVGIQGPPRSLAELHDAVERGMGLHLGLPDGFDLNELVEVLRSVTHLSLGSSGELMGWSALREARSLRVLIIGPEPSESLELDAPHLERLLASGRNSVYAAQGESLKEIRLEPFGRRPWPEGVRIRGPLEYLQLVRCVSVAELPPLDHPESLRTLRLYGPREFDLASITDAINLEWLDLARCPSVLNVEALLELPALREVTLAGMDSMPGWERLTELSVRSFVLEHHRVIPAEDARALVGRHPGWAISPMKAPR